MLIDVSLRLQDGMLFRKGSPTFSINQIKCFHEDEGQYETSIINTPSHVGTHIDIVNKNNKIEVDRFIGRGVLVDISNCSKDPITLDNLHNKESVKKMILFSLDPVGVGILVKKSILITRRSHLKS